MNKYATGYKPPASLSTEDKINTIVNKAFIVILSTLGTIVVIEQLLKIIERGF